MTHLTKLEQRMFNFITQVSGWNTIEYDAVKTAKGLQSKGQIQLKVFTGKGHKPFAQIRYIVPFN
jgi:hypothetical protein